MVNTQLLYGINLLMAAVAYTILQNLILIKHGKDSVLAKAIGKDYKGKLSALLYIIGIASTFFSQWLGGVIYITVALIWLIPDTRIERSIYKENNGVSH